MSDVEIEPMPDFDQFDEIRIGKDGGQYFMWGFLGGTVYVLDMWKGE